MLGIMHRHLGFTYLVWFSNTICCNILITLSMVYGLFEASGTVNVVLSDRCSLSHYTAINLTISPLLPRVSCVYNFFRPTDLQSNFSTNLNETGSLVQSILYEPALHSVISQNGSWSKNRKHVKTVNHVPDPSLWSDRSVLIVIIYHMNLTTSYPSCPKLDICGTPSSELTDLYKTDGCIAELGWVSGICRDIISEPYYSLFQLVSGLAITLDEVYSPVGSLNSSVNMVISTGYRLPPGVFICPPGLFACDPTSSGRPSRIQDKLLNWSYRICLPTNLWCDGVSNCPLTGSDELYCSSGMASRLSQPPTEFPVSDRASIGTELSMLIEELGKFGIINESALPMMVASLSKDNAPNLLLGTFVIVPIILLAVMIIPLIVVLDNCGYLKLSKWPHRKTGHNSSVTLSTNIQTNHDLAHCSDTEECCSLVKTNHKDVSTKNISDVKTVDEICRTHMCH